MNICETETVVAELMRRIIKNIKNVSCARSASYSRNLHMNSFGSVSIGRISFRYACKLIALILTTKITTY